jgi:hypothetical protein
MDSVVLMLALLAHFFFAELASQSLLVRVLYAHRTFVSGARWSRPDAPC